MLSTEVKGIKPNKTLQTFRLSVDRQLHLVEQGNALGKRKDLRPLQCNQACT